MIPTLYAIKYTKNKIDSHLIAKRLPSNHHPFAELFLKTL